MAMNVGSTGKQIQAHINVTPMIDVLLVLLIIFMAITPQKSVGLNTVIPESNGGEMPKQESSVVLDIAADGSVQVNSIGVASGDLPARLTAIFARRSSRVLFLRAAGTLEFQTVASAIDMAHSAGVDSVAFMPRV